MSATFTVRLQRPGADPVQFEAPTGLPVLLAAERAGLAMESSCRNGTCRSCICLMEAGSVAYHIAWPGLSLDEKREGWILPCVAYPTADLALALPL
ncbi:2Fe-2S iron-sulfur cluster-binding protein [Pseudorhodoferax soli]|uniref:Ferredoxin n=1 Tax=Pseudorhodoferax soli TaxID=545864 RepID=A0A368Y8U3_9BURK|nr:2Fe-2S iron-sulfur cluster binding domain-containing protein [Pseudorhodoferax soli]RCW76515.1 ferredoxin [Pseudorhodoferax soli]